MSTAGVTWSSTNASVAGVSGSGLVTGMDGGIATIQAELDGETDGATIYVNGSAQTVFIEEGFEDTSFGSRGWYDNTSLTITSAETHSGSNALEVRFESGQVLPTFGASARHLFDASESLYVRFWVKYSDNWQGWGVGYHPHDFQILTNQDGMWTAPSTSHLTTYIETNYYNGAVRPLVMMRDRLNIDGNNIGVDLTGVTENRAVAGCNGDTDGHSTGCWNSGGWWNEKGWRADATAISNGSWHLVEVYFELNSIVGGVGVPDGVIQYWLDGAMVFNMNNVLFRTGQHPDMGFNQFLIAPYIGAGSPVTQTMWIDDLLIADRR